MIGVRGSFEPYESRQVGMGPTLIAIVDLAIDLLVVRRPKLAVSRCGVDYPANAWLYVRSRRLGVFSLISLLTQVAERCPRQRVVLLGLSQGAEVVRRVLAEVTIDIIDRIAAAVVLGDPTRRPSDPWQHGTTDPHPGVRSRHAVGVPATLHDRMWGYTLDGDEVAANRVGLRGILRSGSHTHYELNEAGVHDLAAEFIAARLHPERSNPSATTPPQLGS